MTSEKSFHRMWLVGFAGHRRLADGAAAKAVIRRELDAMAAGLDGELVGVASAAAGADLLFLEACGEAGLRTIVILPFARERFGQDFEDPAEWQRACALMDAALWCEIAPGNEAAPEAYHVVAREMLEISDRLIFLWDGEAARGLGGTAETVAEAAEWKIPARIIDANLLDVRWQSGTAPTQTRDKTFADLPPAKSVAELFDKLDRRAVSGAPRSRWFAAGSMSVNHLATFLQASLVALALSGKEMGAVLKFVMALVAAGLPWVGSRMRLQEKWVGDRVRAELLRSLIASHEPGSPLRPPALDLFERDQAFLRSAALQLIGERKGWQAARERYLTERLDGQIGYLKSKGELAKRRMRIFGNLFIVASIGALVFTALAIFLKVRQVEIRPMTETWLVEFVPTILPGLAAWSLAMISVFEFKRRSGLYTQLVAALQRLRPKLSEAKCASAAETAVRQIERLLLNELWEWQGPRRK
jgi:hypothetical protein